MNDKSCCEPACCSDKTVEKVISGQSAVEKTSYAKMYVQRMQK